MLYWKKMLVSVLIIISLRNIDFRKTTKFSEVISLEANSFFNSTLCFSTEFVIENSFEMRS